MTTSAQSCCASTVPAAACSHPSRSIARCRRCKQAGKPVVVSMSDVAASGGYYIAAPADEIIASPNTITGSIGVFAGLPTFSRSLAKLGVNVDGVGTTPLSGQRGWTGRCPPASAKLLQSKVESHLRASSWRTWPKGRGKTRRGDRRDRAGTRLGRAAMRCQSGL